MTREDWKRAAKFGAKYILEMNVEPDLAYSGYTCALIGLMTGSEGRYLTMQNWIDDVIIDASNKCPVRIGILPNGMRILHPEDARNLMKFTEMELYSKINSIKILPRNIEDIMPLFGCYKV